MRSSLFTDVPIPMTGGYDVNRVVLHALMEHAWKQGASFDGRDLKTRYLRGLLAGKITHLASRPDAHAPLAAMFLALMSRVPNGHSDAQALIGAAQQQTLVRAFLSLAPVARTYLLEFACEGLDAAEWRQRCVGALAMATTIRTFQRAGITCALPMPDIDAFDSIDAVCRPPGLDGICLQVKASDRNAVTPLSVRPPLPRDPQELKLWDGMTQLNARMGTRLNCALILVQARSITAELASSGLDAAMITFLQMLLNNPSRIYPSAP